MTVIESVKPEEKQVLRNLMQLYKYDFTTFDPEDVDKMGLYDYPYLDYYFVEEDRYAYFIKVSGVLAGFVLVRHTTLETTQEKVLELVEFFVLKKFRRRGVGQLAAKEVITRFSTTWKIGVMRLNLPALAFWECVIRDLVGNRYAEVEESSWDGTVFVFDYRR